MNKKILVLSANPKNTDRLRLDQEFREIEEALNRSKYRDQFEILSKWAVRPRDMSRAILDYEPNIIHFSGHGIGDNGILLEDDGGQAKLVDSDTLAKLFKLFSQSLECVVLNACYSDSQANIICQHIDYVIGMNAAIQDRSAIEFAVGFYDGLGKGKDYDFAYNLGCHYISMDGIQQADVPQLRKKTSLLNPMICLGVNGSAKRVYDNSPDRILDWTEYYDFSAQPRQLATPEIWQQVLLPELREVRDQLAQGRRDLTLDLRGLIPLSGAFAIGAVFQETRGFILQVEQSTGSSSLWKSSEQPSNLKFRVVQECGHAGKDLCVALAISRPSWPQVQKLYENPAHGINAVVYLEPDTKAGASDRALASNAEAIALVEDAKRLIDHYRQLYQADRLHLVFACPMGFAALLGHRLRAVGEIVTYEFTQSTDEPYTPSVRFNPG